jgi:hypothetical protein
VPSTPSSVRRTSWVGRVVGVQPRIALTRSFDQRAHSYFGYALRIRGEPGEFLIGIGKTAQAKHGIRVGYLVSGSSAPVFDSRKETVAFYKTVGLRMIERATDPAPDGPPWTGVAPELADDRANGDRRLDARKYELECFACSWGCRFAVESIVDHWNPSKKRHRFETFRYGSLRCPACRAGLTRKVAERKPWMVYEETGDDEAAEQRL